MEEQAKHRIIQLTAENIKKLKAVSLAIRDGLTVIAGRNGQGKTSLLDAIMFLFLGKRHPDPKILREGEAKGFVELETDDLIMKRTVTAGGGGSLKIAPKEGKGTFNGPQGFLDEITKRICFDPLAFMRQPPKQQAIQLRELVGLDFTEMDADIASVYDERTEINRSGKALSAEIEGMEYDAEATKYRDAVPVREELKSMDSKRAGAAESRRTLDRAIDKLESGKVRRKDCEYIVGDLEKRLVEAKKRFEEEVQETNELEKQIEQAKINVAEIEKAVPDQTELLEKLDAIQLHNANVTQTTRRTDMAGRRDELRRESQTLTSKIEKLERSKAEALKEANFPIDGLAFTGEGVTYNGMPLSQASGAEQIRVAVAVSAAMNPALPVMIIKDGSLLDSDSMQLLAELAQERDLQIIVERIEQDDFVSIIIEDGEILEQPDASNAVTDQGTLTL